MTHNTPTDTRIAGDHSYGQPSVVAAFTEMAPRYEGTVDGELRRFWGIGYEEFIGQLLERLDLAQAASVLDVATGRAAIPLALAHHQGWRGRVVGLDITPAMVEGASARVAAAGEASRIRLTCGSGVQLPFRDGTFSAVVCALATHHMEVPDLLREMRRVLTPGGQLLVADVAPAAFWGSVVGKAMLNTLAWWYIRREGATRAAAEMEAIPNMRTPEQWRAHLHDAGFALVHAVIIRARRRWYPPGILIDARADVSPEGWKKNG